MTEPLSIEVSCHNENILQVRFEFVGGRFRQSLQLLAKGGHVIDRWTDEVASADEDWPASPPIQQLSLELIHDRPTLLGVGQAGKSHWSISVETALGELEPGVNALRFDLACRARNKPTWLGSTYCRDFLPNNEPSRLRLVPGEKTAATNGSAQFTAICTTEVADRSLPTTFRWSYRIEETEGIDSISHP